MALATQCPHCHTTFRVAHDQLKLRAGLVRCGSCKQIFNGIENLLRPEDLAPPSAPPPAPAVQPAPAAAIAEPEPVAEPRPAPEPLLAPAAEEEFVLRTEPEPADEEQADEEPFYAEPAAEEAAEPALPEAPQAAAAVPAARDDNTTDPLLRMTLVDIAAERREPAARAQAQAAEQEQADALGQTIDELQNKPWRQEPDTLQAVEGDALDQAEAAEYEEPAFVRQARRRQRLGRALRVFMATSSVLLLAAALAQGAYIFRDQLAARFPETRPLLTAACAHIGCQVGLPEHIDAVALEASELQTLSADTFVLTALLRNLGDTAQAWPHLELTLNDANGSALVRRVFTPRDYLPEQRDLNQGFDAGSEQPIKLFFELAQLKASGYRVYLFYP